MDRVISRARYKLGPVLMKALLRPQRRDDLTRLGSEYGGWVIPTSLLSGSSVCYTVGVGEDISFDLAVLRDFGCEVFAFDPTPRAVAYVKENASQITNFRFFQVGVWSEDQEKVRFYEPKSPLDVSHSIVNLQGTSEFFEAETKRLSTLMRELGHRKVDLLKLDIEGAEFDVMESLIADELEVTVLCIEFDQPAALKKIWRMVKKLSGAGYALVNIDSWNYTFVANQYAQ